MASRNDKEIFSCLNDIAEITEFLFLSSLKAASREESLKEKRITHVINVTKEVPVTEYKSVQAIRIELNDTPEAKIGVHFDMLADKIEKIKRSGEKVLVHCVAGVSRSATIVIAYLMKHERMCLLDAHALVKQRRPLIRPNSGFWEELVAYEKKLFNKNTVIMVDTEVFGKIPNIYEQESKNMFW